jgi:hypothetical protein
MLERRERYRIAELARLFKLTQAQDCAKFALVA